MNENSFNSLPKPKENLHTEKFSAYVVVCLHENLAKPRFSDWVVLGIEFVKSMEGIPVLKNLSFEPVVNLKLL